MLLSELSEALLDSLGVLTNPADYLSGYEPRLRVVSAHRPRAQYTHWVIPPEPSHCGLRGSLGSQRMLNLDLAADLPSHYVPPRKKLLGTHSHAIT